MFPRFKEQIGTALDLVVEFSTLGEYRLGAGSAPGAPSAPADALESALRLGGLREIALAKDAADRHTVAGGAAGREPVATPAARRPTCGAERRGAVEPRPARRVRKGAPVAAEQLCLAV